MRLLGVRRERPAEKYRVGDERNAMALRREDLSPEQLARQEGLDLSWAEAQRELADPEFRAYLEASIRRIDEGPPAPTLTREEFLAQTEIFDE